MTSINTIVYQELFVDWFDGFGFTGVQVEYLWEGVDALHTEASAIALLYNSLS